MKSRPKDLGTRFETWIVNRAQDAGLIAERLAEGGSYDRGDVRIWAKEEWVIESKDRMQLNIHFALEKAILKSGTPRTVVWWRRMARNPGAARRHQVGAPIVVMTPDTFLELLKDSTCNC